MVDDSVTLDAIGGKYVATVFCKSVNIRFFKSQHKNEYNVEIMPVILMNIYTQPELKLNIFD